MSFADYDSSFHAEIIENAFHQLNFDKKDYCCMFKAIELYINSGGPFMLNG
jgi:hypothetical protein